MASGGRGTREAVLGIDLGTSECKVCLVAADGGVVRTAREGYPTHSPRPGWAEQEPADWLAAVARATRRLLAECDAPPDRIAGLALTSAAHIGVLLNAEGAPVRRALLWNDQRSAAEAAELEREHGETILRQSLQAASTSWTLSHLLWIRRHDPEAWARARRLLLSKDFLAAWLTGVTATDPGTAVSSQLFDATTNAWSPELCAMVGLCVDALPSVRPATAPIGGLTAEAAGTLGLRAGTPVIAGTLDSATELLAAGVLSPGQGLVRLATAGGVECVIREPKPSRKLITYPHPVQPLWYCQAGTNACASSVRWGTRIFGGDGEVPFATWNAWAAATPPGAEGLLFHPYLSGERAPQWDPRLRASFVGATLQHGPGHFARAVYEGTACSIRHAMSALPAAGTGMETLAVVGGGTRSAVWVQILADVLNRPLLVAEEADSAAGAALLGLVGLGLADDLAALAAARAGRGRLVTPDPQCAVRYDKLFTVYVATQESLAALYHRHWPAPA
jgi:xylulokinase